MVAIHSTARGPALGGCRMKPYENVGAAVGDVLRLARAMTYKAACADLPLGGGKGVIALPALTPVSRALRRDALLDFADTVEELSGRYLTAEDVGTTSRDMALISTATAHVTGLAFSRGGSGDPSPATALGVVAALEVTSERVFGSRSLEGRSIAVHGLGHVGARVAALVARAGGRLLVSDIDPSKRALAARLGAEWKEPEALLRSEVELLCPCALGGVLDADSVGALRCRAIAGSANNQLADDGVADLLHARGILFAPDFVVSAGGIINIAVEFEGYHAALARRRVRRIGDTLALVFDRAEAGAMTPLAAAMELTRRRLSNA